MPFVQGTCPNCGGTLAVNNEKDAWVCPYCNTPFIVEKAINNFNVTNNISASTVNIYGGGEKDFEIVGGVLKKYHGEMTEVILPDNVKEISSQAFIGMTYLTSIVINDGVDIIREEAFKGCSSLKKIVIPEGVNIIGNSAFEDCVSLNEVILPKTLINLGDMVFKNCKSLKTLTIPDNVECIERSLCSGCVELESVKIGDNTSINFECPKTGDDIVPFADSPKLLSIDYKYLNETLKAFPAYYYEVYYREIALKARLKCVHCGGDFKGVFKKVCSVCGRPKDY